MPEDIFSILNTGGDSDIVLISSQPDDVLTPWDVGCTIGIVYEKVFHEGLSLELVWLLQPSWSISISVLVKRI